MTDGILPRETLPRQRLADDGNTRAIVAVTRIEVAATPQGNAYGREVPRPGEGEIRLRKTVEVLAEFLAVHHVSAVGAVLAGGHAHRRRRGGHAGNLLHLLDGI